LLNVKSLAVIALLSLSFLRTYMCASILFQRPVKIQSDRRRQDVQLCPVLYFQKGQEGVVGLDPCDTFVKAISRFRMKTTGTLFTSRRAPCEKLFQWESDGAQKVLKKTSGYEPLPDLVMFALPVFQFRSSG
jgi:hypothetical protein